MKGLVLLNRIRFLSVKNELRQQELAKIIHVSQSSLSGYENDKYEPDKKTLLKLSEFFGVSTDYLLGVNGKKNSENGPVKRIPVYKYMCGNKKKASKYILYDLEINKFKAEGSEYFGLQMYGSSMAPRIFPGDLVIVRKQSSAESGDVAVIQVDGGNATVKKVVKHCGGVTLIPYNPMYMPVSYTNDEIANLPVVILGKVVEVRGKC